MDKAPYESIPREKFPYRIRAFANQPKFRLHWHEEIELLWFLQGGARLTLGQAEVEARAGDLIFINSREPHRGVSFSPGSLYYMIQLSPDFFDSLVDSVFVRFEHVLNDDVTRTLAEQITAAHERGAFGQDLAIKRDLYALLSHALTHYVKETVDLARCPAYLKNIDTVNRAMEWLHAHYTEPVRVDELAGELYLSPSRLSHLFKQSTGKSLIVYLNDLRLEKAKVLLAEGSLPVTRIAETVGIGDVNYFSRLFRQKTGMTPTAYQKQGG